MSISKFQDRLSKGGCGLAVLVVCAAVMVGGVFYYSCMFGGAGAGNGNAGSAPVIMHVAGNPIQGDLFERQIQSELSQQGAGTTSPDMQATIMSRAIDQLKDEGAKSAAVEKSGIKTDDASLIAAANEQFTNELDQDRQGMISRKQLPPGASQADFDKAVKAQMGKTPEELRAAQIKQFTDSLKDSDRRKGAVLAVAQTLLMDAARAKHNVPESEVKASYDTYVFEQLRFLPTPASKGTVDARIAAAENDLKKGVPFEKVVDTYSTAPLIAKQRPSENTIRYTARELSTVPGLKPLAALRTGQVSPVIDSQGGKAIFKLVSITSTLPKDYDKNRDKYRKEYIDQLATQDVQAEIDAAKNSPGLLTFDSPAYQALYDVAQAGGGMMGQMMGKPPSADGLKKAEEEAIAAGKKGDARVAALARYEAESALWTMPGGDKTKLRSDRVDTILAILQYFEDFDLRMELVDDYLADKKNDLAAAQLLEAAVNNSNYTDTGIQHFTQIRDKLQQMQRDKTIGADVAKQVENAQLTWSQARADYDKEQQEVKAERAKQAAADAKMRDEEAKAMAKARAEAAKKAKSAPPATPPAVKIKAPSQPGPPPGIGGAKPPAPAPPAGNPPKKPGQ